MTRRFMAALAALDETLREEATQAFVFSLVDQTAIVDREAETAAFVLRPDPSKGIEAAAVVPATDVLAVIDGQHLSKLPGCICRRTGWLWPARHFQSIPIREVNNNNGIYYRTRASSAPSSDYPGFLGV